MIITRTPFRVSFVGGGSDMAEFYNKSTGAVLSVTVNKYMYISSHNFFEKEQIRLKYSQTENVSDVVDIQHPIFKAILSQKNLKGIEISSNADIPAGTGLGSSSSFTVGLLNNLYARKGEYVSKENLASEACRFEIDVLGQPIGKQDQYAAAYGGLNLIEFSPKGVVVNPLHIKKEVYKKLQNNLFLYYTEKKRDSSSILKSQVKNIQKEDKYNNLKEMVELVSEARETLYTGKLNDFGRILHKNWKLKQSLSDGISNSHINKIYEKGLANGALGGKLLGAGGGGFLMFYCEKENHSHFEEAMKPLVSHPFRFDNEGTKIIYASDEYNLR